MELVQFQGSKKNMKVSEWRVRMVYRDFQGMRFISAWLGCDALPVVNGNDAEIDSATRRQKRWLPVNGAGDQLL